MPTSTDEVFAHLSDTKPIPMTGLCFEYLEIPETQQLQGVAFYDDSFAALHQLPPASSFDVTNLFSLARDTDADALRALRERLLVSHNPEPGALVFQTKTRPPKLIYSLSYLHTYGNMKILVSRHTDVTNTNQYIADELSYQSMLDSAGESFFFIKEFVAEEMPFVFVYANRPLLNALGLKHVHQIFGKSDFDFFPESQATSYLAGDTLALRSTIPIRVTTEPFSPLQTDAYVNSSCKLSTCKFRLNESSHTIRRSKPRIAGFSIPIDPFTTHLYGTLDVIADAVFIKDSSRRYIYVNTPFRKAIGNFSQSTYIGKTFEELLIIARCGRVDHQADGFSPPPDLLVEQTPSMEHDRFNRAVHILRHEGEGDIQERLADIDLVSAIRSGELALLESGEPSEGVRRINFSLSTYWLVQKRRAPARHSDGPSYIVGTMQKVEDTILRMMAHDLPLNIAIKDREGRYIYVNNTFTQRHNARVPEQLLGLDDKTLWPPAFFQEQFLKYKERDQALLNAFSKSINSSSPESERQEFEAANAESLAGFPEIQKIAPGWERGVNEPRDYETRTIFTYKWIRAEKGEPFINVAFRDEDETLQKIEQGRGSVLHSVKNKVQVLFPLFRENINAIASQMEAALNVPHEFSQNNYLRERVAELSQSLKAQAKTADLMIEAVSSTLKHYNTFTQPVERIRGNFSQVNVSILVSKLVEHFRQVCHGICELKDGVGGGVFCEGDEELLDILILELLMNAREAVLRAKESGRKGRIDGGYEHGEVPSITITLNNPHPNALATLTVSDNGLGCRNRSEGQSFLRAWNDSHEALMDKSVRKNGTLLSKFICKTHRAHVTAKILTGEFTSVTVGIPLKVIHPSRTINP